MNESHSVGLNIPGELLPAIYHALQAQGERGVYRELGDLERDQADCRERGDCPSCGENPLERDGERRENGRLANHNLRLAEEIRSLNRRIDRQTAEIARLERTTLQPVAGYLGAQRLLAEAAEVMNDDEPSITIAELRDALDSPF